jgi:hypothetical protein
MLLNTLINLFLQLLAWVRWLLVSGVLAAVVVAPVVVGSSDFPFSGASPESPSLPLPSAALPLAFALGLYALIKRSVT